jgi:signal transduction histidine kinase
MHQLFYNLLNNALKFSEDGIVPVIRIECRRLTREEVKPMKAESIAGYYEISVIDNGIGFDEIYAEKIFTIFKRLHSRDTYHGTGIGLSICRKVVHNHGGEIYARSGSGRGATFIIQLPYYSDDTN